MVGDLLALDRDSRAGGIVGTGWRCLGRPLARVGCCRGNRRRFDIGREFAIWEDTAADSAFITKSTEWSARQVFFAARLQAIETDGAASADAWRRLCLQGTCVDCDAAFLADSGEQIGVA